MLVSSSALQAISIVRTSSSGSAESHCPLLSHLVRSSSRCGACRPVADTHCAAPQAELPGAVAPSLCLASCRRSALLCFPCTAAPSFPSSFPHWHQLTAFRLGVAVAVSLAAVSARAAVPLEQAGILHAGSGVLSGQASWGRGVQPGTEEVSRRQAENALPVDPQQGSRLLGCRTGTALATPHQLREQRAERSQERTKASWHGAAGGGVRRHFRPCSRRGVHATRSNHGAIG